MFGRIAPLEVDVGCGTGDYVLHRAQANPDMDFIGFEIRKPLVEAAQARATKMGVRNAAYFYANIHENMSFVEPGEVTRFCVQFPDPCFKKRHWKRRILQPFFVRQMCKLLPVGGEIFAQSDVQPLAEEMYDFLKAELSIESLFAENLLDANPFEERTKWERHHEDEGEPIYRMMFRKIAEPTGPVPECPFRDTNPRRLLTAKELVSSSE